MNSLIEDLHWSVWALECKSGYSSSHGYPRINILHTPPRRGEVDDERKTTITEEDHVVARQIGKGVAALEKFDVKGSNVLIAWYGAYQNNDNRRVRLQKVGVTYHDGRYMVAKHRGWVEGYVRSFREFHRLDT